LNGSFYLKIISIKINFANKDWFHPIMESGMLWDKYFGLIKFPFHSMWWNLMAPGGKEEDENDSPSKVHYLHLSSFLFPPKPLLYFKMPLFTKSSLT
jgi:hypothetical protein